MKLKLIISILLMLLVISYSIGFIIGPFLFVIFFPVVSTVAFVLGFLAIFLITRGIVCTLLPHIIMKGPKKDNKPVKVTNFLIGFVSFILLVTLTANIFSNPKNRKIDNTPAIDTLRTLPYVAWTPAEETISKKGVVKYDPEKAFNGINVCASIGDSYVYLINMKGEILHRWSAKYTNHKWHEKVKLCPNGDLLAIGKDRKLIRFDWNSNVKWSNKTMRYHHEITLAENGDIYVLGMEDDMVIISGFPVPILNDYIVVISPDGKTKRVISLFNPVKKNIPFGVVSQIYRWIIKPGNRQKIVKLKKNYNFIGRHGMVFDIFHNNTITIMDRAIEGLCKKGDLLICTRNLDLVCILDVESEKCVWSWSPGKLSRPHNPTLLENGNILIFDNGRISDHSRIIELDPLTKKIVWEYKANPPQSFYTEIRGACQRLPNGNTLITESNKGRVFEVTSDGEIVWEFYHPHINMKSKKRSVIYSMQRIANPEKYSLLNTLR